MKKKKKKSYRIKRLMSIKNKGKIKRMKKLWGWTQKELVDFITSHPRFKEIPWKKLTISHDFPIKAFADYGLENRRKLVNCLENLSPMDFNENVKLGCEYDPVKFEKWLKRKGVNFKSKLGKR